MIIVTSSKCSVFKMFSARTKLRKAGVFKSLRFVKSVFELMWTLDLIVEITANKAAFSNCLPSTRKQKAGVFKSHRFEERF